MFPTNSCRRERNRLCNSCFEADPVTFVCLIHVERPEVVVLQCFQPTRTCFQVFSVTFDLLGTLQPLAQIWWALLQMRRISRLVPRGLAAACAGGLWLRKPCVHLFRRSDPKWCCIIGECIILSAYSSVRCFELYDFTIAQLLQGKKVRSCLWLHFSVTC